MGRILSQCQETGTLEVDVAGTGVDFEIPMSMGAGLEDPHRSRSAEQSARNGGPDGGVGSIAAFIK